MSGKGAKGLIMGKTPAVNKDKDKKKSVSRSSRAGLQVPFLSSHSSLLSSDFSIFFLFLFLNLAMGFSVCLNFYTFLTCCCIHVKFF